MGRNTVSQVGAGGSPLYAHGMTRAEYLRAWRALHPGYHKRWKAAHREQVQATEKARPKRVRVRPQTSARQRSQKVWRVKHTVECRQEHVCRDCRQPLDDVLQTKCPPCRLRDGQRPLVGLFEPDNGSVYTTDRRQGGKPHHALAWALLMHRI